MTEQEQEEEKYPLSLAETLRLAERVSWEGYKDFPAGFSGTGFYGSVGNAHVLLNGEFMDITATFESPSEMVREEVILASYSHPRFCKIYDELKDREKRSVMGQKKSLLNKLKNLAST